jgi:hypothetical protein
MRREQAVHVTAPSILKIEMVAREKQRRLLI